MRNTIFSRLEILNEQSQWYCLMKNRRRSSGISDLINQPTITSTQGRPEQQPGVAQGNLGGDPLLSCLWGMAPTAKRTHLVEGTSPQLVVTLKRTWNWNWPESVFTPFSLPPNEKVGWITPPAHFPLPSLGPRVSGVRPAGVNRPFITRKLLGGSPSRP